MPNGQQRSERLSFLPSRLSGREIPLPTLRFASEELDGCFKYERKMDSVRVSGPQYGAAAPIPQRAYEHEDYMLSAFSSPPT
jgi:hypothetical protein